MARLPYSDQAEDVSENPNWPLHLEKILVNSLSEELKNHLDETWDRICKNFNELSGMKYYDQAQLKKHISVLHKKYRIVMIKRESSRFKENANNSRAKRHFPEPANPGSNKRNNKASINPMKSCTASVTVTKELNVETSSAPKDDQFSASRCRSALNGMKGVDGRLYVDALSLFQDPIWRRFFMSLKCEKRLNWLKAMLPPMQSK